MKFLMSVIRPLLLSSVQFEELQEMSVTDKIRIIYFWNKLILNMLVFHYDSNWFDHFVK